MRLARTQPQLCAVGRQLAFFAAAGYLTAIAEHVLGVRSKFGGSPIPGTPELASASSIRCSPRFGQGARRRSGDAPASVSVRRRPFTAHVARLALSRLWLNHSLGRVPGKLLLLYRPSG
jgi:hypothetical protein